MMSNIRKFYKEFFGLTEQVAKGSISVKDPAKAEELAKKGLDVKLVDEAQLINRMTDYRGGVEYVIYDAAQAQVVANDIQQWAEKKGFTVINKKISKSGTVGYFYFRLGEDPARESQKIQGYVSQLPSVKHFRFNVRSQRPVRKQNPTTEI
jgi:hypothetical protein